MALLSSLALACLLQGGPELPGALEADLEAQKAWADARSPAVELPARRDAARVLLARVQTVEPASRFRFLLDCEGAAALPVELGEAWRALEGEWPELRVRLTTLLQGAAALETELVCGSLRAAGWLALESRGDVEAIGALLDDPRAREAAQFALLRITGREFPHGREFAAWWAASRDRARADWLADALFEERARAQRRWEELLARDPSWALAAVRETSPAVRRLGYEALRRLEPPANLPPDSAPAKAVLEALAQESDPGLRLLAIPLVTRFLAGPPALQALDGVLASGVESERLRALEQLPALRDPAAAWERLMRELWRAYPFDRATPPGGAEFRAGLWSAVNQTLGGEPAFSPALAGQEIGLLLEVLERLEPDPLVRARVYAAAGRLGQEPFARALSRHLLEAARPAADRAAALESLTSLALRTGQAAELRAAMPALLADAEAVVRARAVRCCARLGAPQDLELLAQRLEAEREPALLGEILKSLREPRSARILERLLAFVPPVELEPDFVRALQAQIGADYGALAAATAVLAARARADSAYALAYGWPREGAAAETLEAHDRLLARTQAAWLLQVGAGGANEARAQDALAFVGDLGRRWPQEAEWPRLRAELALLLARDGEALDAMEALLGFDPALRGPSWPLGLRVARRAAERQLFARGWGLLTALGEAPQEFAAEAEAVRALYPSPAEPPPAPDGSESGL